MIQIYMMKRNFAVQKAERWFKERKIAYQTVDLTKKGPSKKEAQLFMQQLGVPGVFDTEGKLYQGHVVRFTSDRDSMEEYISSEPQLLLLPIVRNGRQVTNTYAPEVWESWK